MVEMKIVNISASRTHHSPDSIFLATLDSLDENIDSKITMFLAHQTLYFALPDSHFIDRIRFLGPEGNNFTEIEKSTVAKYLVDCLGQNSAPQKYARETSNPSVFQTIPW